jgi:hypothetical protein
MPDCDKGCRALFWPGGLETIRQQTSQLNISVFNGGHFDDVEAINIQHSPGITTIYRELDSNFTFDYQLDCIYGNQVTNDSVKICMRQLGDDVALGRSLR